MFHNADFLQNIKEIYIKNDNSYVINYNNILIHVPNNDEFSKEYEVLHNYIIDNDIKCLSYDEYKYVKIDLKKQVRAKRDILINKADIILLKYQEQVELGITVQDDTYKLALLQYKENLRNIPEQKGFPENVVWPELPIKEE